jgi:hypothetical protein
VGEETTVRGVLRDVFDNGRYVYLGFARPHRGAFLARIPRAARPLFPAPPLSLYAPGQEVEITGRVRWYQGDPAITVERPEQILVRRGP